VDNPEENYPEEDNYFLEEIEEEERRLYKIDWDMETAIYSVYHNT
jgi:hypothetical protein